MIDRWKCMDKMSLIRKISPGNKLQLFWNMRWNVFSLAFFIRAETESMQKMRKLLCCQLNIRCKYFNEKWWWALHEAKPCHGRIFSHYLFRSISYAVILNSISSKLNSITSNILSILQSSSSNILSIFLCLSLFLVRYFSLLFSCYRYLPLSLSPYLSALHLTIPLPPSSLTFSLRFRPLPSLAH